MLSAVALTLSIFSQAVLVVADSTITWIQPQRVAIVKLDTPGYAVREASEIHGTDRTVSEPAAILLRFEISEDDKTLLLDGTPFLPLEDYHIPPFLSAYQVPANIDEEAILAWGRGDEFATEKLGMLLELDYDRLVEADPTGGPPFYGHQPILRFRLMGLGAGGKDELLDAEKQEVVYMTLKTANDAASNDPERAYSITGMSIKSAAEAYSEHPELGPEAEMEEECTRKSLKCPDAGVFEAVSPFRTPYRFMWRRKFDEFGRVGSLRHAFVKQWTISKTRVMEDPKNSALVALGVLVSTLLAIVTLAKSGAKPVAPVEKGIQKSKKRVKKVKETQIEVETTDEKTTKEEISEWEEEEEEDSDDEDVAWLAEQAQQAGEVSMSVDEASQLIDLMEEDELKEEVEKVIERDAQSRKLADRVEKIMAQDAKKKRVEARRQKRATTKE